jgi:hypothetical protein
MCLQSNDDSLLSVPLPILVLVPIPVAAYKYSPVVDGGTATDLLFQYFSFVVMLASLKSKSGNRMVSDSTYYNQT